MNTPERFCLRPAQDCVWRLRGLRGLRLASPGADAATALTKLTGFAEQSHENG